MTSFQKTFEPARIVGKDALRVEYYVVDSTGKLVRKRHRISSKLSKKEQLDAARRMVDELNHQLRQGWNPFKNTAQVHRDDLLAATIERYLKTCSVEMRSNSVRSYTSFCNRLVSYLKLSKREHCYVSEFSEVDAVRLMERIAVQHAGKPRTFNNYLMAYRRLWNWMMEHRYTESNVFASIKPKRLTPKFRDSVDARTRAEIAAYLRHSDWRFMVICELIYFCLLRPNEIVQLTPRMIDFGRQIIIIPPDVSKNKREQCVTIPDAMVGDLRELLDQAPCRPTEYLFSDGRRLTPGRTLLNPRSLSKRWARLRKKLALPATYQLYSLKDAGITELILAGVPANEVMHQARHHSLEVTSVYIERAKRTSSNLIKQGLTTF